MPRLLANDFVYSNASTDERYNDYVTPTTPSVQHYPSQRLYQQRQQSRNKAPTAMSSLNRSSKSGSHSPSSQQLTSFSTAPQSEGSPQLLMEPQTQCNVHSFSSYGDNENVDIASAPSPTADVLLTSMCSGDDEEDFEGFDDSETPVYSGFFMPQDHNKTSVASEAKNRCLLKRHSEVEYNEDSEGVVEAIEVDDDDDIEEVDGQILLRSKQNIIQAKEESPYADCKPHTPSKRKKHQSETACEAAVLQTQPETEPEQIVEINSDSTTISQKKKRHQINTKFQLNLSQRQNHRTANNATANKCSTESTSEFPLSSPSNPQQPRGGGKYPPRPPLLKNTLPADSFERQLAMITASNPQMSLTEKIQSWCCEDEYSDVEDVNIFDQEFIRMEEQRKRDITKHKNKRATGGANKQYDFSDFKQMILNNMNNQQHQRFLSGVNAFGLCSAGGGLKDINSTGSDSSKSAKLNDERPSTSAVAQQLLQLRRSKLPNIGMESGEAKKRFNKELLSKRNQNSTTPPATSSSDNDKDCFKKSKLLSGPNRRFVHHAGGGPQHTLHIHEKLLCPSSSEEANSQDVPSHKQLKTEQGKRLIALKPPQDKSNSKNLRCIAGEEIDSVFRLHRLNREIDKTITETTDLKHHTNDEEYILQHVESEKQDIEDEENASHLNYIKKQSIFKTPTVPPKYLANCQITAADSPPPSFSNSSVTANASSELINTHTVDDYKLSANSVLAPHGDDVDDGDVVTTTKVKIEHAIADTDFDGEYHQQHEFCNYLGLTGMSTATAMANAVAELAQCNLTRRSMRVLRQQQQERREKTAKEERELKSLKTKQSKEVKKRRERGGYEAPIETDELLLYYEEGSNSQNSEPTRSTPSLMVYKNNQHHLSLAQKSSLKPQSSSALTTAMQTEPQIKILCHIATTEKKDAVNKVSQEYVKDIITSPIREALMRQTKQKNNLKYVNRNKILDIKEEIVSETKTDSSIHDDEEFKLEEISLDDYKRILRSPRLKALGKANASPPITKTVSNENVVEKLQRNETYSSPIVTGEQMKLKTKEIKNSALENVTTLNVPDKQFHIKSSPFINKENITKDLPPVVEEAHILPADEEHADECDRSLTPTASVIKDKLQAALEESRKTKPSIFIVQSLECKKDKTTTPVSIPQHMQEEQNQMKPVIETVTVTQSPPEKVIPLKIEIRKQMCKEEHRDNQPMPDEISTTTKTKTVKKYLKSRRKSKRHSIFSAKRQLRSHKIIYIKSVSSEERLNKETPKEVKFLRSHNKCAIKYKNSISTENPIHNAIKADAAISPKPVESNIKSYRNAQTETNDLEIYNNQAKTRLMAKASALLHRSRRMSTNRGLNSSINLRSKLGRPVVNLRTASAKTQILQPKICLIRTKIDKPTKKEYKTSSTSTTPPPPPALPPPPPPAPLARGAMLHEEEATVTASPNQPQPSSSMCGALNQETENVVVSSTTNCFDERPDINPHFMASPATLRTVHSSTPCVIASAPLETKDNWTQMNHVVPQGIMYLNSKPSATHLMRNPLKTEYGVVLYMYYEIDILIVVQERFVSFWKFSRLLGALSAQQQHLKMISSSHASASTSSAQIKSDIYASDILATSSLSTTDIQIREPAISPSSSSLELTTQAINGEWILLGELKRLTYDLEIFAPYANRICLHNSTPIYVEMRARPLPKHHRDCNLLSMYINIYYYHDEDVMAKTNSIQLDTIQSDFKAVNYTTLKDSRYFIMTWPQENLLGKTRSGMCKYSLTPQLDTLASIREFKSMRHTIRYLECIGDDKLIGFGDSQLSIWDHRSGDVLMNYDLDMTLGKNLGSVYYCSQEIEQNNLIILFQWRDIKPNEPPQLLVIACTITHIQPSYRVLYELTLPPAFRNIKRAINTGEHLIIIGSDECGEREEELWISCGNPALVALVPPSRRDCKRFYNRDRAQLIELTAKTLNLDNLANHNLKLAAGMAFNTM